MSVGPWLLAPLAAVASGAVLYNLRLLAAAGAHGAHLPAPPGALPRATIVVPAHDEALVIGATLASLNAQRYEGARFDVVVIADNCTDETAQIAAASGARVLVRTDLGHRGKGYALAFAMDALLSSGEPDPALAFVIVDADTQAAPDFLERLVTDLFAGVERACWKTHRAALQGRYGVLNTNDSWRAALMTAALDLVNHVKPLGKAALGLCVGLKGNGMAFTRAVALAAPWRGDSITEDLDYGLDLLERHGITVGYAPGALVRAQMPVSAAQASSQRKRWERGRYKLLRERAPALLLAGIARGDMRLLDAGLDLCAPPLAELVGLHALWLAATAGLVALRALPGPGALWLAAPLLSLLGLSVYVLAGLRVAGAPRAAFTALWRAPFYVLWKIVLLLTGQRRKDAADTNADEWVRTERHAMGPKKP